MQIVSAAQLKAARAILDWSREDFAAATGLSVNTIRNIENGNISARASTNNALRQAIDNAGLELLEDDGIKRRSDTIQIYKGKEGFTSILEDVCRTLKKNGAAAITIISKQTLDWFLKNRFAELGELCTNCEVRCLLTEMPRQPYFAPDVQYRAAPRQNIEGLPFLLYGDKYVVIAHVDSRFPPQFVMFRIPAIAHSYVDQFSKAWDNGQDLDLLPTKKHA